MDLDYIIVGCTVVYETGTQVVLVNAGPGIMAIRAHLEVIGGEPDEFGVQPHEHGLAFGEVLQDLTPLLELQESLGRITHVFGGLTRRMEEFATAHLVGRGNNVQVLCVRFQAAPVMDRAGRELPQHQHLAEDLPAHEGLARFLTITPEEVTARLIDCNCRPDTQ